MRWRVARSPQNPARQRVGRHAVGDDGHAIHQHPLHADRQLLGGTEGRLVGDLLVQVPAIGLYVGLVFHQIGLVLIGLRAEKAEEVIEALTRRPMIERAGIGRLFIWRDAKLSDCEGVVAPAAEDLGNCSVFRPADSTVCENPASWTEELFLPVSNAERVGAQIAVVWKLV